MATPLEPTHEERSRITRDSFFATAIVSAGIVNLFAPPDVAPASAEKTRPANAPIPAVKKIDAEVENRAKLLAALATIRTLATAVDDENEAYYKRMKEISQLAFDANQDPAADPKIRENLNSINTKASENYHTTNYPNFGAAPEGWRTAWSIFALRARFIENAIRENNKPAKNDVDYVLAATTSLLNSMHTSPFSMAGPSNQNIIYPPLNADIYGEVMAANNEGVVNSALAKLLTKELVGKRSEYDRKLFVTLPLLSSVLPKLDTEEKGITR